MDSWFASVGSFLRELNMIPAPDLASRLWNADETGFCTSIASPRVLARKGAKDVHETSGGSDHEFHTLLAAGAADGTHLPPFILYKGVNLYSRWTKGGLAGAIYGVSDSGWMESKNFEQWFQKLFAPAVSGLLATGPVVLFVDGHHSHVGLDLIHLARSKGVHLFCLPPHTTHLLQPLDVGVYAPAKKTWKTILKYHSIRTHAQNVLKEDFPGTANAFSGCGGFAPSVVGILEYTHTVLQHTKYVLFVQETTFDVLQEVCFISHFLQV